MCELFVIVDRDECDVDNGGCEQICKNVIGSYKCECESGYLLAADGHHCKEGEKIEILCFIKIMFW